jgi:ABC-type dipeptide/oligopeptide/nickel transport system permease subunit
MNIGGFDRYLAPSGANLFGTDYSGIDVFTEVLYGARASLTVGVVTGLATTLLSIVVGMTAGYIGGWVDDVLSMFMNVFLVIPQLPLLLVFALYVPIKGPLAIILVISITGWAWGGRVLRSQTMSLRNRDFVQAARMSGESTWRVIFAEIMPNMISLTVSSFIFAVIGAIFTEAALEFLGLGDVTTVSWGTILYNAQQFSALASGAWWNFVFPGLAIALTVTACVFINYGIDTISNPRLRTIKVGRAHRKAARAAAVAGTGVAR